MVTIKQVSALSGVSKSTVSRVIANNGPVSKATREKVEATIAQLGYRPNSFARSLKSNKSNIIGVIVVNMGSPFYAQILGGIQKVFKDSQQHLMVCSGYGDKETEFAIISSLLDRQCDGLLLFLEGDFSNEEIQTLCNCDIPIVLMGRNGLPYGFNSVQVDNLAGGALAITRLIEAGHRKIIHLAGPQNLADARDRLKSFWLAVQQNGLDKQACQAIVGQYTEEFGYQAVLELHKQGADYTAICAGDDDIAAGVYMALKELGKKIPEQVAVIGYDDNFHARHMSPPLTSIRQPISELGAQAGAMLFKMLNQPSENNRGLNVVLKAQLLDRESI